MEGSSTVIQIYGLIERKQKNIILRREAQEAHET